MIICVCHCVNDKKINQSIDDGATTTSLVLQELQIGDCCGKCIPVVREMVQKRTEVVLSRPLGN